MAKPTINAPLVETLSDINGRPNERIVMTYDNAVVEVVVYVERDTALPRKGARGLFVGDVNWGARGRVTIDEAEQFAVTLLDGVARARKTIAEKNALFKVGSA